ncbi:titin-like [Limulus polyphemus]|uniref:Titin-like n=1 Tax=Limulus polyphemus TaxID=6850 RepID=A0ABM1TNA1_LIMPO|nr:titin-like [Limulus polyphemus]
MAGDLIRYVIILLVTSAVFTEAEPPSLHPFDFPKDADLGVSIQVLCNLNKGKSPVKFTWKKDGRPINAGTGMRTGLLNERSSYLVVDDMSAEKMGNYTCVVTNSEGSDSHTARLVIPDKRHQMARQLRIFVTIMVLVGEVSAVSLAPPTIQPFQFPKDVSLGSPIRITCGLLKRAPSVNFVWKKNGQILTPSKDKHYIGSHDGFVVMEIKNVAASDIGNYTCVAENEGGKDEYTAQLVIEEPPTLFSFDFPKDVELGRRVQVVCSLNKGDLPVKFTWTKDDQPISTTDRIKTGMFNEHSSFLIIDSVSALNMGNYTCTVQNSRGSDNHNLNKKCVSNHDFFNLCAHFEIFILLTAFEIVRLTSHCLTTKQLLGPMASNMERLLRCVMADVLLTVIQLTALSEGGVPKLHSFGFPQKVDLGGRVQMVCNLNKGSVPVSFSWTKDGQTIQDGERIEIGSWNDVSSYVMIHSVSPEDIGNYTCSATNRIGTDSFTANLVASEAPILHPIHVPQDVELNGTVQVLCHLKKGSLPVEFSWSKDGRPLLTGAEIQTTSLNERASLLVIRHVTTDDVGNYTCRAENLAGSASTTASVIIRGIFLCKTYQCVARANG